MMSKQAAGPGGRAFRVATLTAALLGIYGTVQAQTALVLDDGQAHTIPSPALPDQSPYSYIGVTNGSSLSVTGVGVEGGVGADTGGRLEIDGGSIEASGEGVWAVHAGTGAIITLDGTSVGNTNTEAAAAGKLGGGVFAAGQDARVEIINNPSISVAGSGTSTTYMTMAVKAQNGGYISLDGGTVSATGSTLTRGLYAQFGSSLAGSTIDASNARISTTGTRSHAVHADGGTDPDQPKATINVIGGEISTGGNESWGLFSQGGGIIHSSAAITTAGQAGFGAFVDGAGFIDIDGGSITTTGGPLTGNVGSFGVLSKNAGALVNVAAIPVTTMGNYAEGLRAELGGEIRATNSVINTGGAAAHGAAAYTGSFIDLTGGSVTANGNAYGLYASGAGSTIATDGTAVATRAGKYGAYAADGGQIRLTGGSVGNTNLSAGSQGIAASGAGSSIEASGAAISAMGEYTGPGELSNAVAASNKAVISLAGGAVLSLSNQYGRGLLASTSSKIDANGVAISTVGVMSNAVHAFSAQQTGDRPADTPEITLAGGSVRTSAADAYGLSAQNNGALIKASSLTIATEGANAYGVSAYNGANVELENASIGTNGPGAYGISVNAMSAAQTPGGVPVANYASSVRMNGGSITSAGPNATAVYLRNDSTVELNGVGVAASGPVLASDFTKAGQTQTITVGAGSNLASSSDTLLRVDRDTAGSDGRVALSLSAGSFASGNIMNYLNGELDNHDEAKTVLSLAGAHWAGIIVEKDTRVVEEGQTQHYSDALIESSVTGTQNSSIVFDNGANVGGSVASGTNSTVQFNGNTTISQNVLGQQGSSLVFGGPTDIGQSVTGVGSNMVFGGSQTHIHQGFAASASTAAFSGATTIGQSVTGASNSSISFTGPSTNIAGSVDATQGTAIAFGGGNTTIAGGVSGSNSSLVFNGASTRIQGAVQLSEGATLLGGTVDTPIAIAGDAVVSSGAVLGGNLFVGGALSGSGGFLSPGNSVGTQSYGTGAEVEATYLAEVNSAGGSDRIIIRTGDIDLSAINLIVAQEKVGGVANGGYLLDHDYTILQTELGNVQNTFQSAALDGSLADTLVRLDPVKYNPQDVKISLSVDPGKVAAGRLGLSRNQNAVLDGALSVAGRNTTVDAALLMPAAQRNDALNQLSGEAHASTQSALHSSAGLLVSTVSSRMRGNAGAGMMAGAPIAQASGPVPAGAMPASAAYPLWADVVGNWNTLDGGEAAKARSHTAGIYVGGDAAVGQGWRVGGALGFTDGRIKVDDRGSRSDVRSYTAAVYGGNSWAAGNGRLNFLAGAGYTRHDIDSRRNVNVGGSQTIKADYHADTLQLFTELGYAIPVGQASAVEPYLGVAWFSQRNGGFDETGGAAALKGRGQTDDITTSTLGLRGKTTVEVGRHEARLSAGLGWRHAMGDVSAARRMSFIQGNGAAFTVAGAPVAKNSAVLDLGAEMNVGKNKAMGVAYSGQFGKDSSGSAGSLYLKIRF
ncbi:autotransporter outer membrane beta-barrel domain-containing protein [Pollutimonas bauzanensis]|nr:autotransporter outer membrane beta-barrel domain-containing protein [Pollutimonas bauzanensis]